LAISSSWGNGHATLWRGLCRALAARGHEIVFFERDLPYYAPHRDLPAPDYVDLRLFSEWADVEIAARAELAEADVAIITSYCSCAREAARLVLKSLALKLFYDLDTPVTLARHGAGESVPYLPEDGLAAFDLVLSFTGGQALHRLQEDFGARAVAPLYGSVDPEVHRPVAAREHYRGDLSYLGTYSADRQAGVEKLFIEPARLCPERRFLMGGAQYPGEFPWTDNIHFVRHLPPDEHAAFFSSSRLTLNVTREPMAALGHCPSGRLFEAAACGVPIVTDRWEGLEQFFAPGEEIMVVNDARDVVAVVDLTDAELREMADRARARVLSEHTAAHRAVELELLIERAGTLQLAT
jgi:spore maturation protein CgeB